MAPSDPDEPRVPEPLPRPLTARDLLESELVGMWADRTGIGDSSEFALELRRQAAQGTAEQ